MPPGDAVTLALRCRALDTTSGERRSDPRRGIVVRVGLALTATGITSAAVDRRALVGAVTDLPMAIAFGLAVGLLMMATLTRPPRAAVWLALAAVGVVHTLAALELSGSPLGGIVYTAAGAMATRRVAVHLRPLMVGAFALWTPALWLYAPDAFRALSNELKIATFLPLAYTIFVIADQRWIHPSERLRRTGYGLLAIAVLSASTARTLVVASNIPANDLVALAAILTLVALGTLRVLRRVRDTLAVATALVAFAALGPAYIIGTPYGSDAVVAPHRAAELLLEGAAPYASFDMPEALARFGLEAQLATHLEDGGVLRTYSYPALSFLVVAPFVRLGLDDIRWIYLAVLLLIAAVAAHQVRPAWRPMAIATVIGSEVIVRQSVVAGVDPTWALLILGAWAARRHRWASAALLGLAIAERQPAWFVAPFFLAAVAQAAGPREAVRRGAIAIGIALAVNAPFIAGAPERAVLGMLAPMFAPLVADGVGLMQFGVTDRYTTLFPRVVYTILSAGAILALLALLLRRPRDLAGAPLVWGLAPLWLAWRSLQNYFAFIPLFALIGDDEIAAGREPGGGAAPT